jgi:MFS family permease
VDRFGAHRMALFGLIAMLVGAAAMTLLPSSFGVLAYAVPLMVITAGYALFQAANNTAVMANVGADQRGVVSGLLNLSRNLGLITGASVMGAVFAFGAATNNISAAHPQAVAAGLQLTFLVAAALIVAAIGIAIAKGGSTAASSPKQAETSSS